MNYDLLVNGFSARVSVTEEELTRLDALLDRLTSLRKNLGRRAVVFLAGMPGAGKSTLSLLLAARAKEIRLPYALQALGLDGFHYPQAVLKTTFIGGVPLSAIKGAPETFDCPRFKRALAEASAGSESRWPVYDRRAHDVTGETLAVTGEILLVEGNWLLLDAPGWREARAFCDHSIVLPSALETVRPRLVARKMRGGLNQADAEAWFDRVDGPNCERFLRESAPADEEFFWTV